LDLLEGVLIDLLRTKWETFVKAKFYRQFYIFAVYFFISLFAFGLRPKAIGDGDDDDDEKAGNSTQEATANDTTNAPVKSLYLHNLTEILCNFSAYHEAIVQTEIALMNATEMFDNSTMPTEDDGEFKPFSECPLLDISTLENRVSWLEMLMVSGFLSDKCLDVFKINRCSSLSELNFNSSLLPDKTRSRRLVDHRRTLLHPHSSSRSSLPWRENVLRESGNDELRLTDCSHANQNFICHFQSTAPSRVMFLFSCWLMLTVPFLKFFCLPELEDHVAVAIMLTTSPYFLFFCRSVAMSFEWFDRNYERNLFLRASRPSVLSLS